MGKTPTHKNKGKRGHKLSHKTARRTKSALAPPDMMWKAFHLQTVKARAAAAAALGFAASSVASLTPPAGARRASLRRRTRTCRAWASFTATSPGTHPGCNAQPPPCVVIACSHHARRQAAL
jgi:hypothetical protein